MSRPPHTPLLRQVRQLTSAGTEKVQVGLVLLLGLLPAGAVVGARRVAPPAPPSRLSTEGVVGLPHRTTVTGLSYSPDGKTLATGNMDSGLYLWDVASGKEVWRDLSVEAVSVAFSPDGRTLAAGGWKGIIRVWDAASHRKLREFATYKDLYTLTFSPDGKVLAAGGRHGAVHLWDAVSGKAVGFFTGAGRIRSVVFSPAGRLLAYGTTGDRAYVLDSVSGEEAQPFRGKELGGGSVAFSADGRIIAIGGGAGGIAFVDFREAATGGVIRRLRTGSDRVHDLAFSPDGRALAVAGSKPAVKVWGLATGQLLGEFEGHRDEVFCVRFSPDGSSLAAGSRDKTALVWDVARRMKKEKVSLPGRGAQALERLWVDLASEEVATAYRAMWTLRAAGEQALPFLRERLRLATAFDERRVKQLIGDLDSDHLATRQRAETELAKRGWVVESALRRALNEKPSPEMRKRLTALVRGLERASADPKSMRVPRAIAVLEWVGSPAAVRTLKTLTNGAPDARLTREAKEALGRLAKRPGGRP